MDFSGAAGDVHSIFMEELPVELTLQPWRFFASKSQETVTEVLQMFLPFIAEERAGIRHQHWISTYQKTQVLKQN